MSVNPNLQEVNPEALLPSALPDANGANAGVQAHWQPIIVRVVPDEAEVVRQHPRIPVVVRRGNRSARRLERQTIENKEILLIAALGLLVPLAPAFILASPHILVLITFLSMGAGLINLRNSNSIASTDQFTSGCIASFVGTIIITGIVGFTFPPLLALLAAHHLIPAIGAAAMPALRLTLEMLTPIVLMGIATLGDSLLGPGHLHSFYESIYLKPLALGGSVLGYLGKGLKTIGMAIAGFFGLSPAPTPPAAANQPLRRSSSGRILAIEPPSGRRVGVMNRDDAEEESDEDLEESPEPSPSAYWDRRPAPRERRAEYDNHHLMLAMHGFDGLGYF